MFVTAGVIESSQDTPLPPPPRAQLFIIQFITRPRLTEVSLKEKKKVQVKAIYLVRQWLQLSQPCGIFVSLIGRFMLCSLLLYQPHTSFNFLRQVVYYTYLWGDLLSRMAMIDSYRLNHVLPHGYCRKAIRKYSLSHRPLKCFLIIFNSVLVSL